MINIIIGILFLITLVDYLQAKESDIFKLITIGIFGLYLLKEFYIFFW